MGWWSDSEDDEDSTSMSYNLPIGAVRTACLGISRGDSNVTTSQRRTGQAQIYGSFSVRSRAGGNPYGNRPWLAPILEYFDTLIARLKHFFSSRHLKRMTRRFLRRLGRWILEIEMGFVWGVAGLSIFIFVFAAIWYIDPALLTLVLRFQQAECKTISAAFLIGVSNCSWTSCKLGCTKDVFKCWQIQVEFDFTEGAPVYEPPWASISTFKRGSVHGADYSDEDESSPAKIARLYPNVRGCGYPPELNCELFYEDHMNLSHTFTCWVSRLDNSIAMTGLDLQRAKQEVILSLIPLLIFIVFVLYAFCRHGVFTICNPLKSCSCHRGDEISTGAGGSVEDDGSVAVDKSMIPLSPKKLLQYKRGPTVEGTKSGSLLDDNNEEMEDNNLNVIPPTIQEVEDEEELGTLKVASQSSSSKSTQKLANKLIKQKSSNSILLPSNSSLTSIEDPQNNYSLPQSHSSPLYTNDIHAVGESRRRRIKRNNLSDTEGFECRVNTSAGIQNSRSKSGLESSSNGGRKDNDFLVHRLSDDQFELHDHGNKYSKSKSRETSGFRPSSNLNIGQLLGDDDVEMVVLAGDQHEDNKTVIDDISRRSDRSPEKKPYHDLGLDLNIFKDNSQTKSQSFHLGVDLSKYEQSTLKTNGKSNENGKGNSHMSYINDVMNVDSHRNPTSLGLLQPRSHTPDSLDSFNFLPGLNDVGDEKVSDTKNDEKLSSKYDKSRNSRQIVSNTAKSKPASIEGGAFDTDSFLDL